MRSRAVRVTPGAVLAAVGLSLVLSFRLVAQGPGTPHPDTAAGVDSILEARTRAISATLRCPVCQGESIQDSPAELAQQMRAVVRDRVRAGQSDAEIKDYFVSKYGEWILLEPRMTGLNVLLYALPVILIGGGLAFVAFLVRKWTTSTDKPDQA